MLNIAIVDHDAESVEQLKNFIQRFSANRGQDCQLKFFPNGMDFVSDYKPVYDLIITEVDLPYLDGISAMRRLRKLDGEVEIIFISQTARGALYGYEVGACDYLIKPISYARLGARLDRIFAKSKSAVAKNITVTVDGVMKRISSREIYYIEVSGHMLIIHMNGENVTARGRLDDMEESLKSSGFFRIYKSYLVNLNCVQGATASTAIVNGDELAISRKKRKDFLAALSEYR